MKYLGVFLIFLGTLCTGCGAQAQPPAPPPIDTGIDPNAWARVPSGEFLMGLHSHETMIGYDHDIMVTSVVNAQYAEYLNQALAAGTVKIVDEQKANYAYNLCAWTRNSAGPDYYSPNAGFRCARDVMEQDLLTPSKEGCQPSEG